ncbi:MAG: aldehyde dehydrogenase family protein, partial [Rhodoblastus sp.]|nr:aldehyde dehydrogenase family protein [Rhodoblastus sp.]
MTNVAYPKVLLLIDGEWTAGTSGKSQDILNPATGQSIGTVPHASKADLDRALAAAQKGFDQWKKVSAFERYKTMRKVADIMRQRAPDIAKIMSLEQGKPVGEALIETNLAADLIDWFAEEARRTYGRIVP